MQTDTRSRSSARRREVREIARRANLVAGNIASVILGKEEGIESCVVALLAGGHVIVEDYPGVGKTLLAKALARSVGGRFSRIQFTPDLLPSDVTGVNVFDQQTTRFEFHPGPVFANVVLADEINRASPKTQSSLLECMEEGQATIDNVAHRIALPFMIIATQNPIEYEGTYPLPEAQLDRFMMRLSLGYPSRRGRGGDPRVADVGRPVRACSSPSSSAADVLAMQEAVPARARSLRRCAATSSTCVAATRDEQGHLPRREPARRHRPPARGQGAGRAARQGLRRAAGRQGPRAARARATASSSRPKRERPRTPRRR